MIIMGTRPHDPRPSRTMSGAARVLIAGAGPVGLAAALRLAHSACRSPCWKGGCCSAGCSVPPPGCRRRWRCSNNSASWTACCAPACGAPDRLSARRRGDAAGHVRFQPARRRDPLPVPPASRPGIGRRRHGRAPDRLPACAPCLRRRGGGIDQDARGVAVRVRSALGDRVERGAYLLAADGMNSAVRACLGIAFDGVAVAARLLQVLTPADLRELVPGATGATWVLRRAAGAACYACRMYGRSPCRCPMTRATKRHWPNPPCAPACPACCPSAPRCCRWWPARCSRCAARSPEPTPPAGCCWPAMPPIWCRPAPG